MAKITVHGFEGEQYTGETAAQVVEAMRVASFGGEKADGIRGYMKQIAKRVYDWCGKRIRHVRSEEFLKDLAKAGLIRIMTNQRLSVGE